MIYDIENIDIFWNFIVNVYQFTFQICNVSFTCQICTKLKVIVIPAYTDLILMKTNI